MCWKLKFLWFSFSKLISLFCCECCFEWILIFSLLLTFSILSYNCWNCSFKRQCYTYTAIQNYSVLWCYRTAWDASDIQTLRLLGILSTAAAVRQVVRLKTDSLSYVLLQFLKSCKWAGFLSGTVELWEDIVILLKSSVRCNFPHVCHSSTDKNALPHWSVLKCCHKTAYVKTVMFLSLEGRG